MDDGRTSASSSLACTTNASWPAERSWPHPFSSRIVYKVSGWG